MTLNMDSRKCMIFMLASVFIFAGGSDPVVERKPFILSSPTHLSVLVNDSVTLPCNVQNLGKLALIWKRSRGNLLFSGVIRVDKDPRIRLLNGSMLHIDLISQEYAGEYVCEISGYHDLKLVHRIQVLVKPTIDMEHEDDHVVVQKGDPVNLRCVAKGFPEPVVTWTFLNGLLPGGMSRKQGRVLSIGSADPMHSGMYECNADNDVGEPATAIFKLKVLYSPVVLVRPEWAHGGEGMSLEFTCTCSAEPPATLKWTRRDGTPLPDDGHISSLVGHSRSILLLQIRNMLNEHIGGYTCTANNSVGDSWKTVEVSGLAEPVLFRNNSTSEWQTSFLLVWTVKSFTSVTEYLLRIRKYKSSEQWTEVTIPAVESHGQSFMHSHAYNVTGLEPGTRYEAVLQAMNNAGWNRPSDTFTFETEGDGSELEKEEITESSHWSLYDTESEVKDSTSNTLPEEDQGEEAEMVEQVMSDDASSFTQTKWTVAYIILLFTTLKYNEELLQLT